jgi:hypothetical protein
MQSAAVAVTVTQCPPPPLRGDRGATSAAEQLCNLEAGWGTGELVKPGPAHGDWQQLGDLLGVILSWGPQVHRVESQQGGEGCSDFAI